MGVVSWQRLLSDALAVKETVVVREVAADHLGREPTRSELSAARRAAHTVASAGQARIVRLPLHTGGRGNRQLLGLARPGGPSPAAVPQKRPRRGRARSDLQLARGLARTVRSAAAAARLLDLARVAPDEAALLAAELEEPLRELARLRLELARRGRNGADGR